MEKKRPYFSFYESFRQAIDLLPIEERLEIYEAICDYVLDRKEPVFEDAMAKVMWLQLTTAINRKSLMQAGYVK